MPKKTKPDIRVEIPAELFQKVKEKAEKISGIKLKNVQLASYVFTEFLKK